MESLGREEREREVHKSNRVQIAALERMRERLLRVNDEDNFQREMYPLFMQLAGEQLPPLAVAGVITLALDRYLLGSKTGPTAQLTLRFIPHFVDAMIADPAQRESVIKYLR